MADTGLHILTIVGARPQFIKAAVLNRYLGKNGKDLGVRESIVHTGQHYDPMLDGVFFSELGIDQPIWRIESGSGSFAEQFSVMISGVEKALLKERPDFVLVYGDTNSTLAGAVISARYDIPLVHVEAGQRRHRRKGIPEELNRVLTDHAAHLCLASTCSGLDHLLEEGMDPRRALFVGDPMLDLFMQTREELRKRRGSVCSKFGCEANRYHVATIHRVENTEDKPTLFAILQGLDRASLPVLLPMHPRLKQRVDNWGFQPSGNLRLVDMVSYRDMVDLLIHCRRVATDSGGVTREAFFARKPCVTLMNNTWWEEIEAAGWTKCVGSDTNRIIECINEFESPESAPQGLFGSL